MLCPGADDAVPRADDVPQTDDAVPWADDALLWADASILWWNRKELQTQVAWKQLGPRHQHTSFLQMSLGV